MTLSAGGDVKLAVISAAAGRMRVQVNGFRVDGGRAVAIEETVGKLAGVRAVRAYPRTATVVVWYSPPDCSTAAILSAIAGAEHVPVASVAAGGAHSSAIHQNGVVQKAIGGIARRLSGPRRGLPGDPPQIERMRQALELIGYPVEPVTAGRGRRTWAWLGWPVGLLVVGSLPVVRAHVWARMLAGPGARAQSSSSALRFQRHRPSTVALTTFALAVPSWGGVAASLALVAVAAAAAYRQRLGLSREIVVAAARAGVQLTAVGSGLLVVFRRGGLPGAVGWVSTMVLIAGQVAGRRGEGVPGARSAATAGVAAGTGVTLGALVLTRVISPQARVIVPVGGMIVSGAMQASGVALRRLLEEVRTAQPAIEARLSLGQSARQALLPHQQSALHTALVPAIDSTKVVGLISLPGAMTGLILAGVDPLTAIRYQIVVMNMLLAANAVAALTSARLAEAALFDRAHRLVPLPPPSNRT